MTLALKLVVESWRLSRFPAKIALAHARALLSIKKISYSWSSSSQQLKHSNIMHQSISTAPSPPPGATAGRLPALSVPGVGHLQILHCPGPGICQPPGHSRAFDTHVVSYQNITTQKVLPEKKADWLICQGQEKIVEGCKGMFRILHVCMHFFIAYQARIT